MISVENLYWVLYENLLRPMDIDCWYYYPFGTQNTLNRYEFQPWTPRQEHHALFHFDQEPLWDLDLGHGYNRLQETSNKIVKILANSEHSDLKRQVCARYGMLDWYFFYHGFAALDWYSDAQFVPSHAHISNAFLSFNHVFGHQRSYRAALLLRLLELDVAHKGSISFHVTADHIRDEATQPHTRLSAWSKNLLDSHASSLHSLPWKLDHVNATGDLSARFGYQEYDLWQRSLWHIVNETVFYEPKQHLTEKVFKPIVAQRPFVLVAAPGNLRYLRSYGFQTFDRWIDESYDDIHDPDQRLDAIAVEIARFAAMPLDELKEIHQDMLPVLQFNKQHFFGQFREIIVEELIDNFEQCIRRWNNGRVDGRELPLQIHCSAIKQKLLL